MILKVISANSVDTDQQSVLGPHCLPLCKNRFEKFARIFSRHKQTTFSDAGFLGILRFKSLVVLTVQVKYLFVLRFYGPVNPMGSCQARSVYLTTCLLGRLSPLSA